MNLNQLEIILFYLLFNSVVDILFLVGLSALDFIAYFVNLYEYDRKVVNKIFLNSIGIFFEIINFGLLSFLF